jgi:hypothetical protein
MLQRDNNYMVYLIEAITYFLAGSFVIKIVDSIFSSSGELLPGNLLAFVIGCILILTGFIYAFIGLTHNKLTKFVEIFNKVSPYLYSILLAITTTEIVQFIVDFQNNLCLSIVAIIFLVFVLVTLVYKSFRSIFQNTRFLLNVSISFNIMAGILLFIGDTKYQVISFWGFSVILLFLVLYRITKNTKKEHDKPNDEI